ncbi:S8 family peptidase [Thalassotalea sp. Y01]|uniref:S8 family serine peptidase n=1 Tax=Thalassotalea sp. Y01 TaxID=2729613 RepID=UPI00145D7459|nr:S8 family peptidase [Thalassotalea sp. Y01]
MNHSLIIAITAAYTLTFSSGVDAAKRDVKNSTTVSTAQSGQVRNVDNLYAVILKGAPLAQASLQSPASNNLSNKAQGLDINSAQAKSYIESLRNKQQQVIDSVAKVNKNNQPKIKFSYQLAVNGFTLVLNDEQLQHISQHADVKSVHKIQPAQLHTDVGPQQISADKVWSGLDSDVGYQGEGTIVGIIDTGINAQHPSFAEIDATGYRHTNPLGDGVFLGDCQQSSYQRYCNNKLIGIWSHPDITNTTTYSGDDPIGLDIQGHGSHVASTAVGNKVNNVPVYNVFGDATQETFGSISGVAPRANIVSYQVCDLQGCWPDITALAVEHAIANGINVLNYSIGSPGYSPWQAIDAMALLSAREAGIHVATSAGNNGADGAASISTPGNAPWLTSVAATTHGRSYTAKTLIFSGGDSSLAAISGFSATSGVNAQIIDAAQFNNGDCLSSFGAGTLTGKVVVCRRGDVARVTKGLTASRGGAAGMILINTADGSQTLHNDHHVLPSAHIGAEDGQRLVQWLASGENHRVQFDGSEMVINQNSGDVLAGFSSRGPEPAFAGYLVPHVSAPGVDIYAANAERQPYTNPNVDFPAYRFENGTSMASPHVAGALALLHGLKPEWSPAMAQSALMLTADNSVKSEDGSVLDYYDFGAGRLNVANAVRSGLVLDENYDNYLNADPDFGGDLSTLNLAALVAQNCMIRCTWTRTLTATEAASWHVQTSSVTSQINVQVSPSNFSLAKGESIALTISAEINERYQGGDITAAIALQTDNSNLVNVTLPLIASFRKGQVPDNIRITANSDKGAQIIPSIVTVGVNHIEATHYALNAIDIYSKMLSRDDADDSPWPYNVFNDRDSLFSMPLSIGFNTRYLEVNILSTSSPDLDLYIGYDLDFDGRPSADYEMYDLICSSASIITLESCKLEFPPVGNYFLAIHNYGDYNNPSNTTDEIEFEVVMVTEDQDQVTSSFIVAPLPYQDIQFQLHWDAQMQADSQYITAVDLASGNAGAAINDIAFFPVRINRSQQSLSLALSKTDLDAQEVFDVSVNIDANNSNNNKDYQIDIELPQGFSYVSATGETQLNGNMISIQTQQTVGASAKSISLTLQAPELTRGDSFVIDYQYDDGFVQYNESTREIMVYAYPSAKVNGEEILALTVTAGEQVTLSAAQSTNPNPGSDLIYQWQQVSGPLLSLTNTNQEQLTFTAPDVSSNSSIEIQLIVNSRGRESQTTTTITVQPIAQQPAPKSDSSGGGSTSHWLLILLIGVLLVRVSNNPKAEHTLQSFNSD